MAKQRQQQYFDELMKRLRKIKIDGSDATQNELAAYIHLMEKFDR